MINDDAALRERLKAFGQQRVDPDVAAAHLGQWHVRVAMYRPPRGPRVVGARSIAALVAFVVGGVGVTQLGGVGVAQRPQLGAEAPPTAPFVGVSRVEPRAFSLVGADEDDASDDEAMVGFECDDPAPSAARPAATGGPSVAQIRAFAWFRADGCPASDEVDVSGDAIAADEVADIAPPATVAPPPVAPAAPPASVAPPPPAAPPASVAPAAPPVSVAPPPPAAPAATVAPPAPAAPRVSTAPPATAAPPATVSPASGGETTDSGQPSESGKKSEGKKSEGKKSEGKKSEGKKSESGKKSDDEESDDDDGD